MQETTSKPVLARFVLFKLSVISAHDSHFAGGKHAFASMASTLAAQGFDVHVVSVASRGKVMVHAGMSGLLPSLSFARPGVVHWCDGMVHHHVVLMDEAANCRPGMKGGLSANTVATLSSYVKDLVDAIPSGCNMSIPLNGPATNKDGSYISGLSVANSFRGTWVIIDADESQKLVPTATELLSQGSPSVNLTEEDTAGSDVRTASRDATSVGYLAKLGTSSTCTSAAKTLFEILLLAAGPHPCLAFVQNVHFLPMGPSGTGPRSTSLLAAWNCLSGVIAVSGFISKYVQQHWPTSSLCQNDAVASVMPPVQVVPLATWGVFGHPPFQDLASMVKPQLQSWRVAQSMAVTSHSISTQGQEGPVVNIAVLKLTPEKGCSIILELAKRLAGCMRFRVVAGDPAVADLLAPLTNGTFRQPGGKSDDATALAAPVEIWEPQPDVGSVLAGCVAVVAPSLWLEAWGMVVTEALLRGLPVLISDLGGLPEAGMGVCPTVAVAPVCIPQDERGVPDWDARTYPTQNVDEWERALLSLLLEKSAHGGNEVIGDSTGLWEKISQEGRQAALKHISQEQDFITAFILWVANLTSVPDT